MHSPIGILKLNTNTINQMFELSRDKAYTLDTNTLGKHLSIFRDRFRKNTPLYMELSFGKPKVLFGINGNDISVSYTVGMSIKPDKDGAKELIYDEFRLTTDLQF